MKTNIVFLDVDGVLNSLETWWTIGARSFSPISVGLVERLCKAADARIVVSSAWRGRYEVEGLRRMFAENRAPLLGALVIGRTPQPDEYPNDVDWPRRRGDEINHWLYANADRVAQYVIIDDDSDMLEAQKPRFVQTTFARGFGLPEYLKALELFDPDHDDVRSRRDYPHLVIA